MSTSENPLQNYNDKTHKDHLPFFLLKHQGQTDAAVSRLFTTEGKGQESPGGSAVLRNNSLIQDRLMTFDADMLSFIPFFFKPLEPFIMGVKNLMIHANQFVGLPTWALIMASCLFIRALLFPLVLVQVKRVGRLAPIAPVFVHLKNTYKDSQLPKSRKLWLATKAVIGIVRAQKLKFFRVWIYTLMNIPIIITMVYAIRQVISDPQFGNQGFLYFSDLMMTDPFGLLPFLTIALYYWNFQRFITK